MNVGVVGVGVVGGACKFGFELIGHNVSVHDIAQDTELKDVLDTEVVYICVPTPPSENGSCDVSIVESVVRDLSALNYNGLVIIKSTVEPGATERLSSKYKNLQVGFVPEFLRERCAIADFTENHDVCIIGVDTKKQFELVKESHGHYPRKFVMVNSTEAELCKYFSNVYNATLITLANSFYEVCLKLDVNYNKVKNAIKNRDHINGIYLDCNKNFRGFGGVCLPKDTEAMASFCEKNNIDVDFFRNILDENKKYVVTVPKGMRKE